MNVKVTIGGKWMLKPYDRRNWQLFEFREPCASRKTNDRSARWFPCDEYFQSIGMALSRIFEYALRDDATEWTGEQLREMVEHIDAIARELRETAVVSE